MAALRLPAAALVAAFMLVCELPARAADGPTEATHLPPNPDEAIAREFSLPKAASSLDASALAWQKENRCSQCHANMMYLVARPVLASVSPPAKEVRELFESLVSDRWERQGLRYPAEAIWVAVPLALNDRATTKRLSAVARKALERMLALQRPDGSWPWVDGAEKTFLREFEHALFAAIGVAAAPEGFAKETASQRSLQRVRRYVQEHPPRTAFQQGMLIWASRFLDGLAGEADRAQAVKDLLSLQGDDGGWAIRNLVAGGASFEDATFVAHQASDGYGTGFAIFVARQARVPADDPRLRRGVAWLKANQRESGRWFTPSLSNRPNHTLSNAGTAFAVLALHACGHAPEDNKTHPPIVKARPSRVP
jgi:squalene-hopene/tetraprenyl-beta-curcumene cyclase